MSINEVCFDIQRRVVANKTLEGWRDVPHASLCVEYEVSEVLRLIDYLRAPGVFPGVRVTFNSVVLKIIAESLKCSPCMNAHLSYSRLSSVGIVKLSDEINIAVPMKMADGRMISPTAMDLGRKSLREVCVELESIKTRLTATDLDALLLEAGVGDSISRLCRGQLRVLWRLYANLLGPNRLRNLPRRRRRSAEEGTAAITPKNLLDATVLVSNIGSALPGVAITAPLLDVIPPQTTAIGLGAIQRKPWVVRNGAGEEQVEIRDILPVSICFDHRVMDLDHIEGFIRRMAVLCGNPTALIEDDLAGEIVSALRAETVGP